MGSRWIPRLNLAGIGLQGDLLPSSSTDERSAFYSAIVPGDRWEDSISGETSSGTTGRDSVDMREDEEGEGAFEGVRLIDDDDDYDETKGGKEREGEESRVSSYGNDSFVEGVATPSLVQDAFCSPPFLWRKQTFPTVEDYRKQKIEAVAVDVGDGNGREKGDQGQMDVPDCPGREAGIKVLSIFAYVTISMVLVFGNSETARGEGFRFPWILTAFQALACFFLSWLFLRWSSFQKDGLERRELEIRQHGLPVLLSAAFYALNIGFSNASLTCVSAAVNQDVRCLNVVFTAIFGWVFLRNRDHASVWGCVFLVAVGSLLGLYGLKDDRSDCFAEGIFFAVASSVCQGLQMVCVEPMLTRQDLRLDAVNLTFYISLPIFVICFSVGNWTEMRGFTDYTALHPTESILILLVTGVLVFLMNLLQYRIIASTNALYFSAIGNVKTALVFVLAWAFSSSVASSTPLGKLGGEPLSPLNWTGVAVAVAGFFLLTYCNRDRNR